ncbi:MAG: M20/M25/M40 family metallo-hydrolase [Planctomycetaceae bacterium]
MELLCRIALTTALIFSPWTELRSEDANAAAVERVGEDIRFFASDELEGRGIETKGIEVAAERIIDEFRRLGLKPGMPDGSYRQPFEVSVGLLEVGDRTAAKLQLGPDSSLDLKVGLEFQPIRRGHDGGARGDVVFVGYGISSTDDKYDDYADIDVAGKIVVMIRREPQQDQDGDRFDGKGVSRHSYIDRKLELAKQHKAAGVILVNDRHTSATDDQDELAPPTGFGMTGTGIPFIQVKQAVFEQVLKKSPLRVSVDGDFRTLTSLKDVEDHIDATLTPVSQPLSGVSADLQTHFNAQTITAFNLIGVLEGQGALAQQTVVVGGHYDHLGYGGFGSRAKSREGEIHNGADDNATGTAAVLEMVRRMTASPAPRRRIVFICFSGEERGLLGSAHYVKHPVVPLDDTIAMLNFDMIGTLRNNRVEVNGVATAEEFSEIVKAADEASAVDVRIVDNPFGGSDHLPFFRQNIPVMFCFTGVTDRYHTPDDDFEMINVPGVVAIVDLCEHILNALVSLPAPPKFQNVSRNSRPRSRIPFLGIVPVQDDDGRGVTIQSVRDDSPALAAGLQTGDVILKANSTEIPGFTDLIDFLRNSSGGDQVDFSIRRGQNTISIKATLGEPR